MFWVRDAQPSDLDGIFEVAQHLDTVNLPADRQQLATLLDHAQRAFSGSTPPFERTYLFVLLDDGTDPIDEEAGKTTHRGRGERIIGTSMILAQHGTRKAPHIFFDVLEEERYSETLDRHVQNQVLRIGYNYQGPTEIGGLILLPEFRKTPHRLGKLLSFVRFLFIGIHKAWFRKQVLSELLPPLEADGTSRVWEHVGRRFTGMTYQEADRLSQHNKEFIRSLFPQDPLYVCLLPEDVQALIGAVGPKNQGVEAMLRSIGFEYARRIDPFDGGPHFVAKVEDITLFDSLASFDKVAMDATISARTLGLVAVERPTAPHFRCCMAAYHLEDGVLHIAEKVAARIGVTEGDRVWLLPAARD